jgi:hypothetical protein
MLSMRNCSAESKLTCTTEGGLHGSPSITTLNRRNRKMVIGVIIDLVDLADCLAVELIDVSDEAMEDDILKAAAEKLGGGWTSEDVECHRFQWFEIVPSAVERLKAIRWPEPLSDTCMAETSRHAALVYAAFAKGGPVRVNALNEKSGYKITA